MLKRITRLFLLFVILCTWVCAEEEVRLPQAVIDLCAAAHPGYEIASCDGWGNEDVGQFALILKRGEDNILCMAEKAQDAPAYQLTIDNTNAVYDGDVLPGLLIDSGGDALFYTYHDVNGYACEQYHTDKDTGSWSAMDVTVYLKEGDLYHSILSGVSDGVLRYQHCDEDELGNVRRSWEDVPIPVSEEFAAEMLPQRFDIQAFDPDPIDGLYPLVKNEAFARSQSKNGEKLKDMDISRVHAAMLFETEEDGCLLRIIDWDGESFENAVILSFSGNAVLDTYHSGEGVVYVSSGEMMYTVVRADEDSWYLRGVDAESGVRSIGADYVSPDGQTTVYRNDGYSYGSSPWCVLRGQRVMLAPSYEEMCAQTDESAYALVCNPNPADRLHLRTKPDKSSYSYGKFYNRTPVLVLERGDIWTKVQIGRGREAMTGYMMTKYLAFSKAEKAALACAFPQKMLQEGQPNGVRMYAEPNPSAVTGRMFAYKSDDFIIGVSGDDWYIVLRADGAVGYVPQNAFWDGNG